MKESLELKLYKELDKLGWDYGLSGDGGDTSCDVTMRKRPLLSYAIYMTEDSDDFVLHRNNIKTDRYGFEDLIETPLQTYKSIGPLLRRIQRDYEEFTADE